MRRVMSWSSTTGVCVIVAVILVAAAVTITPRAIKHDPCDNAISAANRGGITLSDDEDVVRCTWQSSFPDSSGTVVVRTKSIESRAALLQRSEAREQSNQVTVMAAGQPARNEVDYPNRHRSTQVYIPTSPAARLMKITYDAGVDDGLLLTVYV